jgi:anti-anti-sigma regulatory factor
MRSFSPLPLVEPALLLVNLAAVDAPLLARMLLQPHPQVLIDCQAQPCRQSLGLCYFLSQLLALRHRGASVWLSNVDPLLRRCLQQLGLAASFSIAE